MPKIILLNGPFGIGKRVVGSALASISLNGVCIHGDDLEQFVVTEQEGTVDPDLLFKNGATLAANFGSGGYDTIVVNMVFEHPRFISCFLRWAPPNVPIYLITLWASINTILRREQTRSGYNYEQSKVMNCYQAMRTHLNQLGQTMSYEVHSPEEMAQKIWMAVDAGQGRISHKQYPANW